eukprot:TRINITY_DN52623_c0_g4_i1.p1 TRINITY_DN52623_c0_g4~~TRINITY_DN52623_c0_g4_i1.p1  ORF type:complete len:514 (-),score=36.03 TRINITY_DN52623_c0_g4_i1:58-1386(-)
MGEYLIKRPPDWGNHIDVCNFWFLDDPDPPATEATDLRNFIKEARQLGKPIIYFGYGSVPVPSPIEFVKTIVVAVRKIGARALIQSGWADLGKSLKAEMQPDCMLMGRANHKWLFGLLGVVCHHGGIGTLATGLRKGCPTLITPFFGDQFLWADAVEQNVYGSQLRMSDWIPYKLAQKLRFCLQPFVKERVSELGKQIESDWEEFGVSKGLDWFYKCLPLDQNGDWVETVWEHEKCRGGDRTWGKKTKNARPWSDETGILHQAKEDKVPPGWRVVEDWKPIIDDTTDSQGWQYASREDKQKITFSSHDSKMKSLYNYHKTEHTPQDIRRRKQWRRVRQYIGQSLPCQMALKGLSSNPGTLGAVSATATAVLGRGTVDTGRMQMAARACNMVHDIPSSLTGIASSNSDGALSAMSKALFHHLPHTTSAPSNGGNEGRWPNATH